MDGFCPGCGSRLFGGEEYCPDCQDAFDGKALKDDTDQAYRCLACNRVLVRDKVYYPDPPRGCLCGGEMVDANLYSDFKSLKEATKVFENLKNVSTDQLRKLREVFTEDWREVLAAAMKNAERLQRGEDPFSTKAGYKGTDITPNKAREALRQLGRLDLGDEAEATIKLIEQAMNRLQEIVNTAGKIKGKDKKPKDEDEYEYPYPSPKYPKPGSAKADEEDEDEEECYGPPGPKKKHGKKSLASHPLGRLAEGTPLGPREPGAVSRKAVYRFDAETGLTTLERVEHVETDTKTARGSSQQHPSLLRLGGLTTEDMRAVREGKKIVRPPRSALQSLQEAYPVIGTTTERLQELRAQQQEEEAARKALEEEQPARRYKAGVCLKCGKQWPLATATGGASCTCGGAVVPSHGDDDLAEVRRQHVDVMQAPRGSAKSWL